MAPSKGSDDRLRRSSNALLASLVASGIFGVLFWLVAARLSTAVEFGADGLLINTAMVVGTSCYLNLSYALATLVPNAKNAGRLVVSAYAGSAFLSLLGASLVLWLYRLYGDRIGLPEVSRLAGLGFIALSVLTSVFTLQDSVLTAIGRSVAVPIESAIFGVAKLSLLPVMVAAGLGSSILFSWLLPLPVLIIAMNVLIARTLRKPSNDERILEHVRWRDQRAYIAGDGIGALAHQLLFGLLPLVVYWQTDAQQGGYFYAAFVLGSQMTLVGTLVSLSFMAEAARHPADVGSLARTALWKAMALSVGICVVLLVLAPIALSFSGSSYGEHGTATLRLFALAAVPAPIVNVFTAIGRVRRQSRRPLLTEAAVTCGTIGLAVPFVRSFGSPGAAVAQLVATAVVAALVTPRLWRDLGLPQLTLRRPAVGLRIFPISFGSVGTLSLGTVAALVLPFGLVGLAFVNAPSALRVPAVLIAMLTIPGLYAVPIERLLDGRWPLVMCISLTTWILFTQLLLAGDWWNVPSLAVALSALALARLALWMVESSSEPGLGDPLVVQAKDSIAFATLDLASPMSVLPVVRAEQRMRLLVRLFHRPLGLLELTGTGHGVDMNEIRAQAVEVIGPSLERRLVGLGFEASMEALTELPARVRDLSRPTMAHDGLPSVSVVVSTHERPDALGRCLEALARLDYPTFEVVVVDSSPESGATYDLVTQGFARDPRFRYVAESARGVSHGRNRGLSEASHDLVAFIDDDVEVDWLWLHALSKTFMSSPDAACVTGLVSAGEGGAEGHRAAAARVEPNCSARRYTLISDPPPHPAFPFTPGVVGTGSNFALRRSVISQVGLFDELLGPGARTRAGEDIDAFVRLLLDGHALVYEPAAIVWRSGGDQQIAGRRERFGQGMGFAAFLTKCALDRRAAPLLARRATRGIRSLVERTSVGDVGNPRGAELLGMVAGPVVYLWTHAQRRMRV